MDVFSSLTAAKQAFDLLKIIKESRDELVIRKAAGDLSEKITELQMLNAELSGLYQAERYITGQLREENNKIEMFIVQADSYELHKTEGGSVVYRPKSSPDDVIEPHYLCAHCFGDHQISILQPSIQTVKSNNFFVHQCPRCQNEYRMNKVPPLPDVHIPHSMKRY
ncbi:hypothetical protein QVN42_13475 [Yersinia nurmii]|uniref:Coiled-coil protein from phage origin n=1 Tax=Yersinia nurmii TaxID=685706 RepID=A0AAW7K4Y4_9GAMM|nr:hypothetical protein [Yersinia nurmii]MDN0088375.1 hypothetical protein [Yersinia nurmii]